MAKAKSVFFCNDCGYESSGWLGKCPACLAWNTFVEEKVIKKSDGTRGELKTSLKAMSIKDISIDKEERFLTGTKELDRVLGGGIVKGSLILIAGDPGIGKSTLTLMVANNIAITNDVLYVSGEESANQIKMRAERLNTNSDKLFILAETSFGEIKAYIENTMPSVVVIDSIQTMFDENLTSAPGSVSQVREVTASLMRIAKTLNISIIIVGHVTKEGSIAGPRVLEHMVDTVLYFEGERHQAYRILRCVKNRFGSTNEIGVFEMCENGLIEVPNPSVVMLDGRPTDAPGTAVVCALEGTRPMLIEIQALLSESNLAMPRRMATGIDYNRVSMIMAVLEKRAGYKVGMCDAFINVIGGIKLNEPSTDMGIAAAIASSMKNKPLDPNTVFIGEIGLTGEIRSVSQIEKRVGEAFRLGFTRCIIPARCDLTKRFVLPEGCKIVYARTVHDVFSQGM